MPHAGWLVRVHGDDADVVAHEADGHEIGTAAMEDGQIALALPLPSALVQGKTVRCKIPAVRVQVTEGRAAARRRAVFSMEERVATTSLPTAASGIYFQSGKE